jgi:hypothetical protein
MDSQSLFEAFQDFLKAKTSVTNPTIQEPENGRKRKDNEEGLEDKRGKQPKALPLANKTFA